MKIIFFTIKIYLFDPKLVSKHFVQGKIQKVSQKINFFSNIFTFLSVTLQNLEDNLRILANFGKFSRKNSEIYGFCLYVLKKNMFFFVYFNEAYIFYNKNLFIPPKIGLKHFLQRKMQKVS